MIGNLLEVIPSEVIQIGIAQYLRKQVGRMLRNARSLNEVTHSFDKGFIRTVLG